MHPRLYVSLPIQSVVNIFIHENADFEPDQVLQH